MPASSVDLLILGAGWTSTFLAPLCTDRGVTYAATKRTPEPGSPYIAFAFDPASDDPAPYEGLPAARTVLITFPIKILGASERLVKLYQQTHTPAGGEKTGFIQLGSTGSWPAPPSISFDQDIQWTDRHSPIDANSERGSAEAELLALDQERAQTTVLNLSGLWGGTRDPRNWVQRVAPTKTALRNKGSLHLIHGLDVARAVLAIHADWAKSAGQRWILTDGRAYDWWDLASGWGNVHSTPGTARRPAQGADEQPDEPQPEDGRRGPQPRWVRELMREHGVRGLPRPPERLGRALDSREFWETFGMSPEKALWG